MRDIFLLLVLMCVNALLYYAASNKRARRSAIKSHWLVKDRWVQMKETEKEEYEGLGIVIFLLPAVILSGLILVMLVIKIVDGLNN
jgi:ABC-type Fe3+ transport system permease subunit